MFGNAEADLALAAAPVTRLIVSASNPACKLLRVSLRVFMAVSDHPFAGCSVLLSFLELKEAFHWIHLRRLKLPLQSASKSSSPKARGQTCQSHSLPLTASRAKKEHREMP